MKYTSVEEQIAYGLETIEEDRTINVNLRDLMYVHQTLQELNRFFHQPLHYPTADDLMTYLGSMTDGGAYRAIHNCVNKLMHEMLPQDIDHAFDEGDRFDHPDPPYYFQPKTDSEGGEGR